MNPITHFFQHREPELDDDGLRFTEGCAARHRGLRADQSKHLIRITDHLAPGLASSHARPWCWSWSTARVATTRVGP